MFKTLLVGALLGFYPKVYHDIYLSEPEFSKQYVSINLGNNVVEIPIINGYVPDISERIYSDGTIQRTFTYDRKIAYTGVLQYQLGATPAVPQEPKSIIPPKSPEFVPPLKEMPQRSSIKYNEEQFIVPLMKRPSEIR